MTTRYVWHASAQDDSDSTWNSSTLAYLTLNEAINASSSGDLVYVHTGASNPHKETYAVSQTLPTAGISEGDGVYVIGVDKDNSNVYTPATSYVFQVTTSSGDLIFNEAVHYAGIWFEFGDDCTIANNDANEGGGWKDCTIKALGTGSVCSLTINFNQKFYNCDFVDSDEITSGSVVGIIEFIGGSLSMAANGTIKPAEGQWRYIGVDFTGTGTGTEFGTITTSEYSRTELISCRLPSTFTALVGGGKRILIRGSDTDSGNNIWRDEVAGDYAGDITLDTSHYRATTYDGTNEFSLFMEPGADVQFYTEWQAKWVDAADSITFSCEIAQESSGTSDLTDADIWLEVMPLASTSNVARSLLTTAQETRKDTPSTYDAGSNDWTGFTSQRDQKISVTGDHKRDGFVLWRVGTRSGAADVYIDPDIYLT